VWRTLSKNALQPQCSRTAIHPEIDRGGRPDSARASSYGGSRCYRGDGLLLIDHNAHPLLRRQGRRALRVVSG
jgi:hypothetical protein